MTVAAKEKGLFPIVLDRRYYFTRPVAGSFTQVEAGAIA
jgi:hypothetical protein